MTPYYQDDWVTLYHGDSRTILPSLGRFSLVVTSPPYGDIRAYGSHRHTDLFAILDLLADGLEDGGVLVWNTADQTKNGSESGESFRQALHAMACGLRLHDTMIYCKESVSFPDSNRYHPAFEFMFVFSNGRPRYFNGIRDRKNRSAGTDVHGVRREADGTTRRPSRHGQIIPDDGLRWNWWLLRNSSQEEKGSEHPARMPMAMATGHIRTWSVPGDLVLDPFAGSGTTLRAAKDLGRRAVGIEIEERYCEIAAKRCAQDVLNLGVVA